MVIVLPVSQPSPLDNIINIIGVVVGRIWLLIRYQDILLKRGLSCRHDELGQRLLRFLRHHVLVNMVYSRDNVQSFHVGVHVSHERRNFNLIFLQFVCFPKFFHVFN